MSPHGRVSGRLMLPVLLILIIFADVTYALTTVAPVAVSQAAKTAAGVSASVTYVAKGNLWAGEARYVKRTVQLGKQTLSNIIKNRAFNPLSIGVAVAITAAGYYLDTTTQEVYSVPPTTQPGPYAGEVGICNFGSPSSATYSDCAGRKAWVCTFATSTLVGFFGQDNPCAFATHSWKPPVGGTPVPTGLYGDMSDWDVVATPGTTVTDDEVLADIVPLIPDSQWPNIIESPDIGAPDVIEAPEIANPFQDIIDDLEAFYDTDSNTNPDTDIASGDTGIETLKTPDEQLVEEFGNGGGLDSQPIDVSALSLESTQQQVKIELQTLNQNLNPASVDISQMDSTTINGQINTQFDQLETDIGAISFGVGDWLDYAVIWPTVGSCTPYVMDIGTNAWGARDWTIDMCSHLQPLKDLLGWAFFISTLFFMYRATIKG